MLLSGMSDIYVIALLVVSVYACQPLLLRRSCPSHSTILWNEIAALLTCVNCVTCGSILTQYNASKLYGWNFVRLVVLKYSTRSSADACETYFKSEQDALLSTGAVRPP
jgi:hypothetical protein